MGGGQGWLELGWECSHANLICGMSFLSGCFSINNLITGCTKQGFPHIDIQHNVGITFICWNMRELLILAVNWAIPRGITIVLATAEKNSQGPRKLCIYF